MNEKSDKLINVRAFAIMSVVIAHSVILYADTWQIYQASVTNNFLNMLHHIIICYVMPLFFSLSGYLFAFTYKKRSVWKLILNKGRRLLIPWITIGLLYMIPLKWFIGYPGYQSQKVIDIIKAFFIIEDAGHLWYLPVLFVVFVIAKLLLSLFSKVKIADHYADYLMIVIGLVLYFEGYLICFKIPILLSCCAYYLYFAVGFFFSMRQLMLKQLARNRVCKVVLFVISIAGVWYCTYIPSYSVLLLLTAKVSIILSIFVWMPDNTNSICRAIDKNSFGLYLFHSPLTYIAYAYFCDKDPFFIVGFNFFLCVPIAYGITAVIRKTPLHYMIGE